MTASYEYWSNALGGIFGPVHDSDPQSGFFRKRAYKAGPFLPVAIFEHDGKIVALVDSKPADAAEIWTYVCQHPIAEQWYRDKIDGKPWPDEDASVTESIALADNAFRPFLDTGYSVSMDGKVKGPKGNLLSPRSNGQDYQRVQLGSYGDEYIHRMVAIVFHGEPPTPEHQVDHINSNRADNRAANLRWVSKDENLADRDIAKGEDHHNAKVTEAQVRLIREGVHYSGRDNDLASAFGVSRETVRDIRLGKGWSHVKPSGGIGDNNPPTDEAETMREQIEAAAKGVADYAQIADDETAAKAQSLRSRLLELSGDADKKREAEKKPHLEAGRAVDTKWQPLVKAAKAAADTIRNALSAHETRKANAAEAARKAEDDRQKALAEALAKNPQAPVAMPQPTPAPIAPTTTIRGAYGRGAAVKVVKIATVEDYDEATTYFRNDAEYRSVIDKLAQRAVDAGYTVPGVSVSSERKVA